MFAAAKVLSSYGPLAYFSDIFISGKNVVISAASFIMAIGHLRAVGIFY